MPEDAVSTTRISSATPASRSVIVTPDRSMAVATSSTAVTSVGNPVIDGGPFVKVTVICSGTLLASKKLTLPLLAPINRSKSPSPSISANVG